MRDVPNIAALTASAVQSALAEFNHLGRQGFLDATGFAPSDEYYVVHGDYRYDSEPIVSYAHQLAHGSLLKPHDLSDGEAVKSLLEGLGFDVRVRHDPAWTWEEIVLACVLTADNGWKKVQADDPRAVELSNLLQVPAIHSTEVRTGKFRNAGGIARKTANIATQHPGYSGVPTRGNKLDRLVLDQYQADPERIKQEAAAVRAAFTTGIDVDVPGLADLEDTDQVEGRLLIRVHLERERSSGLKAAKIADARKHGKAIACEACGFDFAEAYGTHGADYIECHHRTPLFVTGEVVTSTDDLALICSNCHRMIHRRVNDWLTVEDLALIVNRQRQART